MIERHHVTITPGDDSTSLRCSCGVAFAIGPWGNEARRLAWAHVVRPDLSTKDLLARTDLFTLPDLATARGLTAPSAPSAATAAADDRADTDAPASAVSRTGAPAGRGGLSEVEW